MEYCIYICERKYNNMSVCIIAKHISRSRNFFIAHLIFGYQFVEIQNR